MTKTFSLLFIFLFLASCGKGGSGGGDSTSGTSLQSGISVAEMTDAELQSEVPPVEALTFNVQAKTSGFSRLQEEKIDDAIDLIKRVVASDEFKRRVLNKTYNGKKRYVDNGGLTNSQIYKKILEASEKLTPGKNNTMDITLKSYFVEAPVIGYTMQNIKTVYLNTRFLNMKSFKTNQVAMNLTHEWLHKLGFKHASERTANRPHSVPYAIGYIMRDLASRMK